MRHHIPNIINTAGHRMAIALLCFISAIFSMKGSFAAPDFAFPATVRREAEKELKESLARRDMLTALYAANQITAANRLTSSDSIGASLANYELIASKSDPAYRDLANLLRARVLADFYTSRRYIFDRRELPAEPLDPEPALWSGEQFRNEISRILVDVLKDRPAMEKVPLEEISLLLDDSSVIAGKGFSVLDFTTYRIISLSQRLNLEDEVLKPINLIDNLILADDKKGEDSFSLYQARVKKLSYLPSQSERVDYAKALLGLYSGESSYRPLLVASLCQTDAIPGDSDAEKVSRYRLLERTVSEFPDSEVTGCLKNMMAEMKQPTVNFETQAQWLSVTPQKLNVISTNMAGKHLLLIPISASQGEGNGVKLQNLIATGKIIDCGAIRSTAQPYTVTDTVSVPGLKSGYYAVALSSNSLLTGMDADMRKQNARIINVSDISLFTVSGYAKGDKNPEIYVIDSRTGNPVAGAKVTLTESGKKGKSVTLTTNSAGMVKSPFEYGNALVTYKGNRLKEYFYSNGYYPGNDRKFAGEILTDLALYHPGDSVQCSVVAGRIKNNLLSPANGEKITVRLYDPNGKLVESKEVESADMGRTATTLSLPSDGLTGQFRISAVITDGKGVDNVIANSSINVADYTSPTFMVTLSEPRLIDGDDIGKREVEIEGSVATYSGMPLEDCEVKLTLFYMQPYWRRMSSVSNEEYGAKAVSDRKGHFSLKVDSDQFSALRKSNGVISVNATATSPDGETQMAAARRFPLGVGYSLEVNIPEKIEVMSDSLAFSTKVTDLLGNPVKKIVRYEVFRIEKSKSANSNESYRNIVKSGDFESPSLKLTSLLFPSGKYEVRFVLPDAYNEKGESGEMVARNDTVLRKFVVWRSDDTVPPVETSLWVPRQRIYADAGKGDVEVTIGNSYTGSKVFCMISNSNGNVEKRWISPKGENMTLIVKAPKAGERVSVNFFAMHDLQSDRATVMIYPAEQKIEPKFEVITFRDHLVPGDIEQWCFRFTESGTGVNGAVMAVLSNKSLNAITPFEWSFNLQRYLSSSTPGNINTNYQGGMYFYYQKPISRVKGNCGGFVMPDWKMWGSDFSNIRIRGTRMYKNSMATSKNAATGVVNYAEVMDEAADGMMLMEAAVKVEPTMAMMATAEVSEEEDTAAGGNDNGAPSIELRDTEMPLAFFKPDLRADENGMVEVDFTVPNFNTTWVLQLLGYDASMRSAILKMDATASKPVMVSSNIPAYLHTGDKAVISANIFNNTDQSLDIHGRIEVIDPSSGSVLAFSEETFHNVEGSGSRLINLDLKTPVNLSSLIVKAVAISEKGSDGEQTAIQVLPSSQPVTDSYTFYLSDSHTEAEVLVPALDREASVTLNYCGSPAWFVLTSLSGLAAPDSESAMVLTDALFANAMAGGIIGSSPAIRAGLKSMLENPADNTLLSPLEQNQGLKLTALGNTPWVNNAENESERMASLADYMQPEKGEKQIEKLISRLVAIQGPAGGWRWFKQMPESGYITEAVLKRVATLKSLGYLPDSESLQKSIVAGLKYADAEKVKSYNEWIKGAKTTYPLNAEIDYFLMREQLSSGPNGKNIATPVSASQGLKKMQADLYARLPREWKKLNLFDKIQAARLLNYKGENALAREIMSSVLQFASFKEGKGMWFDVESLYGNHDAIMLTAACVEGLKEVDPANPAIAQLVQYLVLSRQTQNWSESSSTADISAAVAAVVRNSDFASIPAESTMPEILINGKREEIPAASNMAGNIYLTLTPDEVSGKTLTLRKGEGSTAWGGVMVQHVEGISRIKPQSVGALKIQKQLFPVEVDTDGKKVGKATDKFRKGDRIKVSLAIESDRDMDYVMIRDARGACMRPVEMLTEYRAQDGMWMLVEPRTGATNIYITSMPKGKYIISYEVFAERDGEYASGITEIQTLYYPMISAHTGGTVIEVK